MGGICGTLNAGLTEEDQVRLHTLPVRGQTQPIRYALFLVALQFQEVHHLSIKDFKRYNRDEVQPSFALPALERGAMRVCYAQPAISYVLKIANKTEFTGKSHLEAAQISELQQLTCDLMDDLQRINHSKAFRAQLALFGGSKMPLFDSLLDSTVGGHYLGQRASLSSADLFFYQLTFWVEGMLQLKSHPKKQKCQQYQRLIEGSSPLAPYFLKQGRQLKNMPFFDKEQAFWATNQAEPQSSC